MHARVRDLLREQRERHLPPGEWPDVGALVERVADDVPADDVDERVEEARPDPLVHIHSLHRATALARVVEGPVGHRGGRRGDIGVLAHVDRILAPELELHLDQSRRHGGSHSDARRV